MGSPETVPAGQVSPTLTGVAHHQSGKPFDLMALLRAIDAFDQHI
jgi:hypothetical protein